MAESSKIVLNGEKSDEQIEIDPSVIEVIMGIAAKKVDGVVELRGNDVKNGINRVLGRETRGSGVNVHVDQDNKLSADVYVSLEAGVYVPEVAMKLQEALKEQVMQMTDLVFKEIKIHVASLVFPEDNSDTNKVNSDLFAEDDEKGNHESTPKS